VAHHLKLVRKDMHLPVDLLVVAVEHGLPTHQVVPLELVVHLLKVATHTVMGKMVSPTPQVVAVVQAEQVLRRCTTTAVQVELELQVP
jgi:hypothetical protein